AIRRQGHRRRVGRIDRERLAQTTNRRCETLLGEFILQLLGAERQIIRFEIRRRLALEPSDLGELQIWLDRGHDALGESILQLENIAHVALEAISPDMSGGDRINELAREAQAVPAAPNAAFEDVAHAEIAPDVAHVNRFAFVDE